MSPWVQDRFFPSRSAHALTRTNSCASLLRSTPVYTILRTVQTLPVFVCKVLWCFTACTTGLLCCRLCCSGLVCIFVPYIPGSFLSRTLRVNMSNNNKANCYNVLMHYKVELAGKFNHSSMTPCDTQWQEWVVKLRYAFGSTTLCWPIRRPKFWTLWSTGGDL